jgi:tetratricopeptide (TPR) repeat protein
MLYKKIIQYADPNIVKYLEKKVNNKNYHSYYELASYYFKLNQIENCLKITEKAIKLFPDEIEIILLHSDTLIVIKEFKQAEKIFQIIIDKKIMHLAIPLIGNNMKWWDNKKSSIIILKSIKKIFSIIKNEIQFDILTENNKTFKDILPLFKKVLK